MITRLQFIDSRYCVMVLVKHYSKCIPFIIKFKDDNTKVSKEQIIYHQQGKM